MTVAVNRFTNGPWKQNCYWLARSDGEALLVDPGSAPEEIAARLEADGVRPVAILNTHAHFDHLGGVHALVAHFDIPFYLHRSDERLMRQANLYRRIFSGPDNIDIPESFTDLSTLPDTISVGAFTVRWHHCPGHTAGSVALEVDGELFTGDTLFRDEVGRTDLPGGSRDLLATSLAHLVSLDASLTIRPGHGPSATLAEIVDRNAALRSALAA